MAKEEKALHKVCSEIISNVSHDDTADAASQEMDMPYLRKGYRPVAFSKDNIFSLSKRVSDKKACFIDGGQAILIDTPSVAAGFVRIAAVVVEHNKCIMTKVMDFYALAQATKKATDKENRTSSSNGGSNVDNGGGNLSKIVYKVKFFGSSNIDPFEADAEEISGADDDEHRPSGAISLSRRLSEIRLAEEMAGEILDSGDIIVLDGSLRTFNRHEKEGMGALYDKCCSRDVLICAISKTCRIITDSGYSLTDKVSRIAAEFGEGLKLWYYHPVAISYSDMHKADFYLVKLNSSSEYIFPVEVYKEQAENADIPKILGFFAYLSRDLAFPGYPYWLIKADQIARVPEQENETLTTMLFAMDKGLRTILLPQIRAVDAHSVLDNIR